MCKETLVHFYMDGLFNDLYFYDSSLSGPFLFCFPCSVFLPRKMFPLPYVLQCIDGSFTFDIHTGLCHPSYTDLPMRLRSNTPRRRRPEDKYLPYYSNCKKFFVLTYYSNCKNFFVRTPSHFLPNRTHSFPLVNPTSVSLGPSFITSGPLGRRTRDTSFYGWSERRT